MAASVSETTLTRRTVTKKGRSRGRERETEREGRERERESSTMLSAIGGLDRYYHTGLFAYCYVRLSTDRRSQHTLPAALREPGLEGQVPHTSRLSSAPDPTSRTMHKARATRTAARKR